LPAVGCPVRRRLSTRHARQTAAPVSRIQTLDIATNGELNMEGWAALYIFMLAGFAGFEVISRVPSILHTPLLSGSNFIHGIVLVGAMVTLGMSEGGTETTIGYIAVLLAAGNVVGGYVVTERMLEMFQTSGRKED